MPVNRYYTLDKNEKYYEQADMIVNYTIKEPYIFDFLSLKNEYKEKELEDEMINNIRDVLIELGKGFSFVINQYKISVGGQEFFIYLLLCCDKDGLTVDYSLK